MNVGIVVEGADDVTVYRVLIKRVDPTIDRVHARECFGRHKLKDKFLYLLREFASNPAAFGLKEVLVIRDSDCNDPGPIEQELEGIFAKSNLRPAFDVAFHATKCKVESWLLADVDAINMVSFRRGGRGGLTKVTRELESYNEADQLYERILSEAGLQDTSEVMKEIAQLARLEMIAERCPRFRHFMGKITRR